MAMGCSPTQPIIATGRAAPESACTHLPPPTALAPVRVQRPAAVTAFGRTSGLVVGVTPHHPAAESDCGSSRWRRCAMRNAIARSAAFLFLARARPGPLACHDNVVLLLLAVVARSDADGRCGLCAWC